MPKNKFWFLAAGLSLAAATIYPLIAQESRPQPVSPQELYRPTAAPDRVILTWNGDPTRSQAVTWRTDNSVQTPVAEIAVAEAGPGFVKKARRVSAATTALTSDLGAALYHSAQFEGLEPSTRYAYRVGDGVNWSEWFQFRTAADRPEPFSFIYFGDAQNDLKSMWSRVIREAYSDAPRARFIVHAGDLVNRMERDAEWGEWHYAAGWINGTVPSIPTPGNHEYGRGPTGARQVAPHWRPQFMLPENGPPGLEETAYYIDYQGLRVVSLNSNEKHAEQAAWLEEVLSDNPNRWTVLTFHHPIYATARGRDNAELRRLWEPIIQKHQVDLVLQGHDHTYARGNLNVGFNKRDETGTVYVVSVSGPKMYAVKREPWMRRVAEDTQLYQIISIDGDSLRYEARTATGEVYDGFELLKRQGRANELIERVPKQAPERIRVPMAPPG